MYLTFNPSRMVFTLNARAFYLPSFCSTCLSQFQNFNPLAFYRQLLSLPNTISKIQTFSFLTLTSLSSLLHLFFRYLWISIVNKIKWNGYCKIIFSWGCVDGSPWLLIFDLKRFLLFFLVKLFQYCYLSIVNIPTQWLRLQEKNMQEISEIRQPQNPNVNTTDYFW